MAAISDVQLSPGVPSRLKIFDRQTKKWQEIAHGKLLNPGAWSPDSKHFYYQDILGEGEPVFRVTLATGKTEAVFDFAPLLRAGYVRCAFLGFDSKARPIAVLTRSESDLYRLDLELP